MVSKRMRRLMYPVLELLFIIALVTFAYGLVTFNLSLMALGGVIFLVVDVLAIRFTL